MAKNKENSKGFNAIAFIQVEIQATKIKNGQNKRPCNFSVKQDFFLQLQNIKKV